MNRFATFRPLAVGLLALALPVIAAPGPSPDRPKAPAKAKAPAKPKASAKAKASAKLKAPAKKKADQAPASRSMTFGWPFVDPEKMKVRGGTTSGSGVTLATDPSLAWKKLRETDLTSRQRDRRAILAMAGSYRVSFQFIETAGFTEDYTPARPYFSWGTEHVRVLANTDDFVSLQHTLVMYFKDEKGQESEPMVMKHWRQDWRYEDGDLHTYRGHNRWKRNILPRKAIKGRWTQAVYQVDDSPRYEVVGHWRHAAGTSTWTSKSTMRPLPRREFSVRDDYNVLEGFHIITINPTGWVHQQHNRKLDLPVGGRATCLACEIGINRYERISAPDLEKPADEYFAATGRYWREVRQKWDEVFRQYEVFRLRSSYDDRKLYEHHFGYAAGLGDKEPFQQGPARKHARETVEHFLQGGARSRDAAGK